VRNKPPARAWCALAVTLVWGPALLSARPAPKLLLTSDDFARIAKEVQTDAWAKAARDGVVASAQSWPASFLQTYGLNQWAPPPEGGQWSSWYACPVHSNRLQYKGPGQNICPVDGKNWTGWPYDQVIYEREDNDSASAARDNGLAYQFTGDADYAKAAAQILLAYADVYNTYPIHDNNNQNTKSGGRVTSQTLDESNWIIPIAWAYDLISNSGVLTAAQASHIENDLLRSAVTVISKNDMTTSNWQSWHNAGMGAVGYALDDQTIISNVLNGKSGFYFQMGASVYGDGVWWEGSWGYHFFALSAHCYLAEMAARAGTNLYSNASLHGMFLAPVQFAMPNLTLPEFNDNSNVSLPNETQQYEVAYQRYADPLFAAVLNGQTRGTDSLYWGAEALPSVPFPTLASMIFPDSGNAVLRAAGTDHYLAMKFGPYGSAHGHYDKLNFVTYDLGGVMAVDPGSQAYSTPVHLTWDKETVAHNTMVVDETTQLAATGNLHAFATVADVSAVRADAGPAYQKAYLERTILLTPEYEIDSSIARATDNAVHKFDWVYHNYGAATASLPLAPYTGFPSGNGYQHLTNNQSATTSDAWQVNFDMNGSLNADFGSIYVNNSPIQATFQYSTDQASQGRYSGRMTYDFTASGGYIVYSIPATSQPAEVPSGLNLMIYGDGSKNTLKLRLYDATSERFSYTVGPVDWTGWKKIVAPDPATWKHSLGNNDGIIDTPVKTIGIELDSVTGAPQKGTFYVDDVSLDYPSAGHVEVQDFELVLRSLRLWMLPASGTTLVVGDGLGPNLDPVPFAMARRSGTQTQFISLLEPYGDAPGVTTFQATAANTFRVTAATFDDTVSFDDTGNLNFVRRNQGQLTRLGLAGGTTLSDNGQLLLQLAKPVPMQADYSPDGTQVSLICDNTLEGTLTLLAPKATQVLLGGVAVRFRREGDYVVVDGPTLPGSPRRRP
jgi:hypothetical protein